VGTFLVVGFVQVVVASRAVGELRLAASSARSASSFGVLRPRRFGQEFDQAARGNQLLLEISDAGRMLFVHSPAACRTWPPGSAS
jgi:hypothetical protein